MKHGEISNIEVSELPKNVKEGDILRYKDNKFIYKKKTFCYLYVTKK